MQREAQDATAKAAADTEALERRLRVEAAARQAADDQLKAKDRELTDLMARQVSTRPVRLGRSTDGGLLCCAVPARETASGGGRREAAAGFAHERRRATHPWRLSQSHARRMSEGKKSTDKAKPDAEIARLKVEHEAAIEVIG